MSKKKLTKEQVDILDNKGTEPPFTGDLLYNEEHGEYRCVVTLPI